MPNKKKCVHCTVDTLKRYYRDDAYLFQLTEIANIYARKAHFYMLLSTSNKSEMPFFLLNTYLQSYKAPTAKFKISCHAVLDEESTGYTWPNLPSLVE